MANTNFEKYPVCFMLQNIGEFGDSGGDSSDGECSDATVRTSKAGSSATW